MAGCLDLALLEVIGDNCLYALMTLGLQNSDMLILIPHSFVG